MRNERHAGAQDQCLGDGGCCANSDERIERPLVLVVEFVVARGWGGLAAERNMGVLRKVERREPAGLSLAGKSDRIDRSVGQKDRQADSHVIVYFSRSGRDTVS